MATTPRGPRQSTGHINWNSFVGANRGGANRTARALMAPTETDLSMGAQQHEMSMPFLNRDIEAGTVTGPDFTNFVTADDMERYSGASYGGPNAATDNEQYAAGLGMAQRAGNESQRLADMYSRMGALKDTFGKDNPGYSRGMQAFDSALLDSTSRGAFKDLKTRSGGLLDKFSASTKAVGDRVGEAKQKSAAAVGEWGKAYDAWRNAPPPQAPRPPGSTDVPEYLAPNKKKDTWMNRAGRTIFGGG